MPMMHGDKLSNPEHDAIVALAADSFQMTSRKHPVRDRIFDGCAIARNFDLRIARATALVCQGNFDITKLFTARNGVPVKGSIFTNKSIGVALS
jgi:hypothetical protein